MKKSVVLSLALGTLFILASYAIFPEKSYEFQSQSVHFEPAGHRNPPPSRGRLDAHHNSEKSLLLEESPPFYGGVIQKNSLLETLKGYSPKELIEMQESLKEMVKIQTSLAAAGSNVVIEVLKNQDGFYETTHYPCGEVYDPMTDCQYYYHAHREGEHGHFHTFHIHPSDSKDYKYSHLISISMDNYGRPIKLFAVTQWTKGEIPLPIEEAKWQISHFHISHNYPSLEVNRWLNCIYKAFRPQMLELIKAHIAKLETLSEREKREEIVTSIDISIDTQALLLEGVLHNALIRK